MAGGVARQPLRAQRRHRLRVLGGQDPAGRAGANAGALLLSDGSSIPAPEADYMRGEAGAIDYAVTNGDTGVVSGAAATTLANLVGVSGFVD